MELYIQKQLLIIVYSLILGLIFGVGYDIMRILHMMLGNFFLKKPIVFLLDLVYMLLLTASYSIFVYAVYNGMHRMFIILAILAGFILYYNTVGRLVIAFSETIIRWIRLILHYVIAVPVRTLAKGIKRLFCWIGRRMLGPVVRRLVDFWYRGYTARQKKRIGKMVRL